MVFATPGRRRLIRFSFVTGAGSGDTIESCRHYGGDAHMALLCHNEQGEQGPAWSSPMRHRGFAGVRTGPGAVRMGIKGMGMRMAERLTDVKGLLSGSGMSCATFGLACAFTVMGGMRLNTLDGVYPVELSLVVRHALGMLAAVVVTVLLLRRKQGSPLLGTPRRVVAIAVCCSLSLLLRYSNLLLMVSSPAVELAGRLLEELFTVLLIVAWAERIVPLGFERTLACFACSVTVFAGLQILFSFFQRVPCTFVLTVLPFVSAALFKASSVPGASGRGAGGAGMSMPALREGGRGSFVDFSKISTMVLYYCILILFVFIAGQMLRPTLELQRQGTFAQLSIAIGNAVAGFAMIGAVGQLPYVRQQPRFVFMLLFLVLFALETIAFALVGHLDAVSVTVYLALTSIAVQIGTLLIWLAPFAGSRDGWSPVACVALGYACNLFARTVSCVNMLVGQEVAGYSIDLATVAVLVVVLALCLVFIVRVRDGKGAPVGKSGTPFKDTIAMLADEYCLTAQEANVFELLAKGRNARSVSEEMSVSLNTTKSHMRSLYAKLDIHSQQELLKLVDDRRRGMRPAP